MKLEVGQSITLHYSIGWFLGLLTHISLSIAESHQNNRRSYSLTALEVSLVECLSENFDSV